MVGKELAISLTMPCKCDIGMKLLSTRAFRWVLAVSIGLAMGVGGGLTVLSKLHGPISVVQGSSMVPTFESGARIYTAPVNRPLQRGDIVLVEDGLSGRAIKRIIGLPGEKIRLWRGFVFVNNRLLKEPYLPKCTFTYPDHIVNRSLFSLGKGSYFLLGDNRDCSYDSRNYGPLYQNSIVALVPQDGAVPPEFTSYALPVHGREIISVAAESGTEKKSVVHSTESHAAKP